MRSEQRTKNNVTEFKEGRVFQSTKYNREMRKMRLEKKRRFDPKRSMLTQPSDDSVSTNEVV